MANAVMELNMVFALGEKKTGTCNKCKHYLYVLEQVKARVDQFRTVVNPKTPE